MKTVLKIFVLFVIATAFITGKSEGQQIILVTKDSMDNYHLKELSFFKVGYSDGYTPIQINVVADSIITIETQGNFGPGIRKSIYKIMKGELVKIRDILSKKIAEKKGYYLFDDGSRLDY